MVTYEQAKEIILDTFKESEVLTAMDAGDKYIFAIKPIEMSADNIVDNSFSVDKKTGEIKEYSMLMDPEEVAYAIKHVIERKGE